MLTVAALLGLVRVVASFALFYILGRMGFSQGEIQSTIFLKLLVAGHATLFLTRTTGWSR